MPKKIIYIYPSLSTFIKKDIQLLKERYVVVTSGHSWISKALVPFNFVKQTVFLLANISNTSAIIVRFAGYWSLLPSLIGRVFKIKVFIIVGGTDAVSYPEINYGSLRKPVWKWVIGTSYKYAYMLVPVHESLAYYEDSYFNGSTQGFRHHFPKINTPFVSIYNGYSDPGYSSRLLQQKKKDTFACVGYIKNNMTFKLKGIDLLLELARSLPEAFFTIIGVDEGFRKSIRGIPTNVQCLPPRSQEEFREVLISSQYYIQLSISEGFPNSICEAMLHGCIPIGSSVNAIPLIIGKTGLIIEKHDSTLLLNEVQKLRAKDNSAKRKMAAEARERVLEEFHLSKRATSFYNLIENDHS